MQATAAISYAQESFDAATGRLMGRHAAGEAFLQAMVRHAGDQPIHCFAGSPAEFRHFDQQVAAMGNPNIRTVHLSRTEPERLSEPGCLYVPNPMLSDFAYQRRAVRPARYSLCGITHTLATHRVLDGLGDYLTAPLEPWDALICTSRCARSLVKSVLEAQAAYLEETLGVRPTTPIELPIIPLGVDCARLARGPGANEARARWRARLGIAATDVAVLYLGRLSYHAKANPAPMYLGLEAAASAAPPGARVHLILAGWFSNEALERGFRESAAALCPSVNLIVVDGRTEEARAGLWHAAELFTSLSDNIQETFGLTPIEAMAAGLPVVASDWDGYRDTVKHGETGILVPTMAAPAGCGAQAAQRYASAVDSYDRFIGNVSLCTAVDVRATAVAYARLIGDADLRRSMGEAGAAHARKVFDWSVVIAAYRALWDELAARRATAPPSTAKKKVPPLRPDPFALFADFPSAPLSMRHRIAWIDGMTLAEASRRLDLPIASFAPYQFLAAEARATFCESIRLMGRVELGTLVGTMPAGEVAVRIRTLVWLAKLGIVAIEGPATEP